MTIIKKIINLKLDIKIIFIYLIIIFLILDHLPNKYLLLDIGINSWNTISEYFYGKIISYYGGTLIFDLFIKLISQKMLILIILTFNLFFIFDFMSKITSSRMARLYAGILYTINPYTYIRLIVGYQYIFLAYVMVPLLLKVFINILERQQKKEIIKFTFILSIVAFNIHMLIIALIIMIIIFIFWFNKYRDIRITKLFAISGIFFILLNSYWIIPVLTAKNTIVDNITDKDYEVFVSKGSLFDIAGMYGFWREGYSYAKDFIPGWQILYLIILSLTIIGFLTYYKDDKIGYIVNAIAIVGIIGFVLALGIKGPLYLLYEFDNPILKGFRDSHKFVAMLVFSYATLGGLGMNKIKNIYDNIDNKNYKNWL